VLREAPDRRALRVLAEPSDSLERVERRVRPGRRALQALLARPARRARLDRLGRPAVLGLRGEAERRALLERVE